MEISEYRELSDTVAPILNYFLLEGFLQFININLLVDMRLIKICPYHILSYLSLYKE